MRSALIVSASIVLILASYSQAMPVEGDELHQNIGGGVPHPSKSENLRICFNYARKVFWFLIFNLIKMKTKHSRKFVKFDIFNYTERFSWIYNYHSKNKIYKFVRVIRLIMCLKMKP